MSRRHLLGMSGVLFWPSWTVAEVKQPSAYFVKGVSGAEHDQIVEIGRAFQSRYELPGISLAMSYRGKLKLLACFGYARRLQNIPVTPTHQFRIASVSKPITAVAILRLQERRQLSIDDRVFAHGGSLSHFLDDVTIDADQRARLKRITIRHLLQHRSGGWSNQRGEAPMFARPALGMSHPDLIRWTLVNMPLKNPPGENYAYSNFGYCLLGRVIEAATGKTYEDAVKELVLHPAGAKSIHVGKHQREQRRPDEVEYYDRFDPYGTNMDVSRMDSHGGWISTASDLVRFAQVVDGFDRPPDLLTSSSIGQMTTPVGDGYGLGWNVNAGKNWWHTGSFNGGSSILARIHDGHCWAVLVNTRSYQKHYFPALDRFPWDVRKVVKAWGNHDLFDSV